MQKLTVFVLLYRNVYKYYKLAKKRETFLLLLVFLTNKTILIHLKRDKLYLAK